MSRIGKLPISLPDKVKVAIDGQTVTVEGPKGRLSCVVPKAISTKIEDKTVTFSRKGDTRQERSLHGLARSLVNNMVVGTSDGFKKQLEIQGIGFKAAVQGKNLNLSLGFSHPIVYPIPEGIKVTVEDNVRVLVEGVDKQLVGAVAAAIRRYYPPEPYKGKGVRYAGEFVRRKEGKTAQGK